MKKLLVLLVILVAVVGCDLFSSPSEPNINAGFTWTANGLNVQFLNQTIPEGKSWRWLFGDSSSASHQKDAVHLYQEEGTYRVDLRSCSKKDFTGNCSDSSGFVTVTE